MNHREIGQNLDLFMFSPLSPGNPIWLDKGNTIYSILSNKIRTLNKNNNYLEVRTPILWKIELFQQSGHWEHYANNMFILDDYALKPMNCPGHMLIFKSKLYSYKDLPLRIYDQSILHRNEIHGALGGLTRCRSFCQDDGHVFISPELIKSEIENIISMIHRIYKVFNMNVRTVMSTRPDKFMGEISAWDNAENTLHKTLLGNCEVDNGGGAFYGPKIDFIVKDSLNREWQTATIQLDFQLPKQFDLHYIGEDNNRKCPVVIHRAMYGSFERFIGIILEHYQGKLPVWLNPIQAIILPIADRHIAYCKEVLEGLKKHNIRAEINLNNLTLSKKIALAQEQYINYMLVVGDKEQKPYVNVRRLDTVGNESMQWPMLVEEIHNKEVEF